MKSSRDVYIPPEISKEERSKKKSKEYSKRYFENNRDKCTESRKKWRHKNKSAHREINKRYRENPKNKKTIRDVEKRYYQNNKEKCAARQKAYREKNKEKIAERNKLYREQNKEKLKEQKRQYYLKHKKHRSEQAKEYYKKNKPNILKATNNYKKRRVQTDPLFAAKQKLRKAVISAFERIKKNKPTNTLNLLGCSWEEAKKHFEKLFQPGMTWLNHGAGGWHIDHIKPVASFKENELHLMNYITNLQPLWESDNRQKRDKYEPLQS